MSGTDADVRKKTYGSGTTALIIFLDTTKLKIVWVRITSFSKQRVSIIL